MDNDNLFPSEYQKFHACVAALFMASSLIREGSPIVPEKLADSAIDAAETLLDRLGLVNPDHVAG